MFVDCMSGDSPSGHFLQKHAVVVTYDLPHKLQSHRYEIMPNKTVKLPADARHKYIEVVNRESWCKVFDGSSGAVYGGVPGGRIMYKYRPEYTVGNPLLNKNAAHLPPPWIQKK